MSPLRNAVGLVYGDERGGMFFGEGAQQVVVAHQALGGDIQQVQVAGGQAGERFALALGGLRRIAAGGAHAGLLQGVGLVFHQGDERGDHHPDAFSHHRGDLIAQRFSPAGGHERQRVAAAGDMADNLRLRGAKRGVAENAPQNVQRDGVSGGGRWDGRGGMGNFSMAAFRRIRGEFGALINCRYQLLSENIRAQCAARLAKSGVDAGRRWGR